MSIATENRKAREWLTGKMMTEDTASAIIDMDNIAWSEGQGPKTTARGGAWNVLLRIAEEVAGRESDQRNWERSREKTT